MAPKRKELAHIVREQARGWVLAFVRWFNDEHRHSVIRFVTPKQRRAKNDVALPARRQ